MCQAKSIACSDREGVIREYLHYRVDGYTPTIEVWSIGHTSEWVEWNNDNTM